MHTWKYHISSEDLLKRTGLKPIENYVTQRRQLRWAGHISQMSMERLPQKMTSSWVRNKHPRGCPRLTYGRGLYKALKIVKIDKKNCYELASDCTLR